MKTTTILSAHSASTRYPGSPLVELRGPGGLKTLVRRSGKPARALSNGPNVISSEEMAGLVARLARFDRLVKDIEA